MPGNRLAPNRVPVVPRRPFRRFVRKSVLLGAVAAAVLIGLGFAYVAVAPTPPDRFPVQTAYLFDVHGERLAALSAGENRQVVALKNIAPVLQSAVLAAEDRRFYKHRGVDPFGIARALLQDLRHKGRRQGGSTITQQYVKNAYVGHEASVARKLKEAAIAVKLERRLSKDEILQRYLNTIYFGRGAYGVEAAARAYFGVSAADVDLPRSAYLAALIRGPESTDATKNLEQATRRRSSVLSAMVQTGAITESERAAADHVPLLGPNGVKSRRSRPSAYDHPDIGVEWFVDSVRRELVDRYGEQTVQTQGLRVTTMLDFAVQRAAYRAAYVTVLPDRGDPSAAVVVLDHDGAVRAMVGGRNWSESKVNLAVGRDGGGLGRPAGSTFKPFVLAAVLRAGYSLESSFPAPATLTIPAGDRGGADWLVRNVRGESYGTLSLADATRLSVNTVFAQLVSNEAIGASKVAEAAELLGIRSPLHEYPSLALGTAEVSPLEMADAYLTLANHGVRTYPTLIKAVTTADGRALRVVKPESKRVMKVVDADRLTAVLRDVVRSGTGAGAAIPSARVAGKTGTTNDSRDAWFVGFTPRQCCVTAVWMGYPEGAKSMGTVHGVRVSGGTLPARIFAATMRVAVPSSLGGVRFPTVADFGGRLLPGATRQPVGVRSTAPSVATTEPPLPEPPAVAVAPASRPALGEAVPAPTVPVQVPAERVTAGAVAAGAVPAGASTVDTVGAAPSG
jgi:penicillin-binding protein 1A